MQTQLTLKNIDGEIVKKLKSKAKRIGMDLHSFILSIFKRELEIDNQIPVDSFQCDSDLQAETIYHDLDYLAGTWTEDDAKSFTEATSSFNKIDAKLWE